MKTSSLVSLFFVAAALTLGSADCVHKPSNQITPLGEARNPTPPPATGPGEGITLPPTTTTTGADYTNAVPFDTNFGPWTTVMAKHTEESVTLKLDTVYFDFDSATIKKTEYKKLEDVAAFLKSHQADALRVEGNCDERGTEKYNLSLGDKRALAVREYLVTLGIDSRQITTVSYGTAKPAALGHDETAWSKNRRDDFTLFVPKSGE